MKSDQHREALRFNEERKATHVGVDAGADHWSPVRGLILTASWALNPEYKKERQKLKYKDLRSVM